MTMPSGGPSIDQIVEEFKRQRRAGKRTVVHATNVDQAIEVALALKASGKGDWFRGQTQDWAKLAPTFYRLSNDERELSRDRLDRFSSWLYSVPGLEEIADDADKLIAVAQHYGIPTTFLDFTTDPRIAGFFACHGDPPTPGTFSCIICLDLKEAKSIWEDYTPPDFPKPQALEIDVSNLWRLEAQNGTFVWCPYDTLDGPYPLDRILFPYTGPSTVPVERIYPAEASPLEHLLDHYFQQEKIQTTMPLIREWTSEHLGGGESMTFSGEEYLTENFAEPPTPHPSWPNDDSPWIVIDREQFRDVLAGSQCLLDLDRRLQPAEIGIAITAQSLSILREPSSQTVKRHWQFRSNPATGGQEESDRLTSAVQKVWEGMSRLPFSNDQIAVALGRTVAFIMADLEESNRMNRAADLKRAASKLLDNPVRIELAGLGENVHARAWVSDMSLRSAIRPDFASLLVPEKRDQIMRSTISLLISVRNPRLLFDFEELCQLFASEVIPTQVALDFKNPTFFSPARLDVLGGV